MPTNILVVDDNPAIRHSLRSRIEDETDWKVCGEAENGKVAVDMVQRFCPDVIILDLSMPVMNGLDAAREISEIAPKAHILLFTLHSSPQLLADARNAGVNDVLSKSDAGGTVVHAIRSLLAAQPSP
jgi:DNA-binding NarL/FixJ family response regulator